MAPGHIVIIGGGLTGLASALHLARRFPDAQITLLEQAPRFGGWVRSETVELEDKDGRKGRVLLEAGPRTARPVAKSVLELINLLGLQSSTVTIPRSSPIARNRFLHVPPERGLLPLPSSLLSLFTSPLSGLLLSAVLGEPFRAANAPPGVQDESAAAFFARRLGAPFARTLGSALVHGIYAADARQLSVRAAFPSMWEAEKRGWGSMMLGFMRGKEKKVAAEAEKVEEYDIGDVARMMKGVAVFTFKDGIEQLSHALVKELQKNEKVTLLSDTQVKSLKIDGDNFEIQTTTGTTYQPTHVVSAIPLPALHTLLEESRLLPNLLANPSASVTVVNLVFPAPPPSAPPLHPPGFGFLIPRPEGDYTGDTPGFLGVVFDSNGTDDGGLAVVKMTAIMGGPYPLAPGDVEPETVRRRLAQQLMRDLPVPLLVRVHKLDNCIPTPTVGHVERMEELRAALQAPPWNGRLEVIGASVTGVSIGDCVEAGRKVGRKWE